MAESPSVSRAGERAPLGRGRSQETARDRGDGGADGGDFGFDEGGEGRRRYSQIAERSRCRFCRDKQVRVDYKDVLVLQKLCTSQGRIFSRKRSGNCATHQRLMKKAIKQARFIGLLPFTM